MIPNNSAAGTVTGTLTGNKKIKMQVSVEALPSIMEVLTKLYGDEKKAGIREYSTNAWDSHIFAGMTHLPIEVSTPTIMSPFLRVKDYGLGMDETDIEEVFSQYGESTKRESTATNGSMGVGAKVGLALASQFTVIGVKNGVSTTVAVSRDSSGVGEMEIVDIRPTDEPNGVEIMVPASDSHGFERRAKEFFQFWKKGTVLLNGEDPTREFEMITDHLALWDGDEDIVVMGNVPYPVEYEYEISKGTTRHVVAFVEMNNPSEEVVFMPNREGLNYNDLTINSLDMLRDEFTEHIGDYVRAVVEGSSNYTEAVRNFYSMRDDFGSRLVGNVSYKDINFDDFKVEPKHTNDLGHDSYYYAVQYAPYRSRGAVSNRYLNIRNVLGGELLITGYNGTTIASAHRSRIKEWARANGVNVGYGAHLYLVSDRVVTDLPFFDGMKQVDWKVLLEETKPAPKPRQPRNSIGSENYEYKSANLDSDGKVVSYSSHVGTLDPSDYVIYLSPRWNAPDYGAYMTIFIEHPDAKVVITPVNRHAKIARLVKNSEPFVSSKWSEIRSRKAFDEMTPEDRNKVQRASAVNRTIGRWELDRLATPRNLPLDKIDDPRYTELKKWRAAADHDVDYDYYAQQDPRWNAEQKVVTAELKSANLSSLATDYPLVNWSHQKHTILYINAVYNESK